MVSRSSPITVSDDGEQTDEDSSAFEQAAPVAKRRKQDGRARPSAGELEAMNSGLNYNDAIKAAMAQSAQQNAKPASPATNSTSVFARVRYTGGMEESISAKKQALAAKQKKLDQEKFDPKALWFLGPTNSRE